MKILILNGPNLNRLGTREPSIYGTSTMADCMQQLAATYPDIDFDYFQSNVEGFLIDRLQQAADEGFEGVVFNAGAYTHTSIALRDCIASLPFPVVEVHISNVHKREEFRHKSVTAPGCVGQICGLGTFGYIAALEFLKEYCHEA
jgi:3-dehydroquinate dehydratase-2